MMGNRPINRFIVAFRSDHFRGQIIWRSAQSPRDIGDFLGKSEIGNLQMTMPIEQEVFGLEVPIDDMHGMEVVKRQCDFRSVEFGNRIGKTLCVR